MNGPGRYPPKLYIRFANEFAVVLSCGSIVASIIPVIGGKINPPEKSSNHRRVLNNIKSSMNGMGAAQMKHKNARAHVTYSVFGASKPPILVVTLPPTITPATGPVILTIPKAVKASA